MHGCNVRLTSGNSIFLLPHLPPPPGGAPTKGEEELGKIDYAQTGGNNCVADHNVDEEALQCATADEMLAPHDNNSTFAINPVIITTDPVSGSDVVEEIPAGVNSNPPVTASGDAYNLSTDHIDCTEGVDGDGDGDVNGGARGGAGVPGRADGVHGADEGCTVVYAAAALGVVHDIVANTQRFFEGQTLDITCMAVAQSDSLVVTGCCAGSTIGPNMMVSHCIASPLDPPHHKSAFTSLL